MKHILFLWSPATDVINYIRQGLGKRQDIELIIPPNTENETLLDLAKSADVIIGWNPTKELLHAAVNLKLFINPGAGIKHLIELFRSLERKVILINGHGNSYLTAQHAVAMLMALNNKVVCHHNWMQAGKWRLGDNEAASIPMRDRTVGLLGYGAINQKVHKFLAGFDLKFAACRRSWENKSCSLEVQKYKISELHAFLTAIDILIIAIPHTKDTENLIGVEELEKLGKKGLLVNVGRGVIVNQADLYQALKEKTISGAAIDVWYDYKAPEDKNGKNHPAQFPFYELDNLLMSPHRAASPFSDIKRWSEVIENIQRYADNREDYLNIIDLEQEY